MDQFEQHFLSQKYGRAKGSVQHKESGNGSVTIEFSDPGIKPVVFLYRGEDVDSAAQGSSKWLEHILRSAIYRLHRLPPPLPEEPVVLKRGTPPWIGDFCADAAGESTLAYRQWSGSAERRRKDLGQQEEVERGVEIGATSGRYVARFYLLEAGIPPSVIRRVLSNSRERRRLVQ